jgi:mannosyltransferase OCH1-like enzyme
MRIPQIIHQLWKDEDVPARWQRAAESVKKYHKGWEYRLWTDRMIDRHVKTHHAEFYPIFIAMNRPIMRVDVFRYLLMHDIGGLYCDLDYEFLRPFDYGDAEVVLSKEFDQAYGDEVDQIANCVFASVPGHPIWRDIIADVRSNPPDARTAWEVCAATGPELVTRVFFEHRNRYSGIKVMEPFVLLPRRVHGRYERKYYLNTGHTYGFHHGWGSWKDRWTWKYARQKLGKWGRWLKRAPWEHAQ